MHGKLHGNDTGQAAPGGQPSLDALDRMPDLVWNQVTDTVSMSAYQGDNGASITLVIEALTGHRYEWTVQHSGAPHHARAGIAPSLSAAMAAATAAASSLT
jgi:hypothetical protein